MKLSRSILSAVCRDALDPAIMDAGRVHTGKVRFSNTGRAEVAMKTTPDTVEMRDWLVFIGERAGMFPSVLTEPTDFTICTINLAKRLLPKHCAV